MREVTTWQMSDQGNEAATWDALVLGAGPAGLTAGLFLARHGRRVLMIDQFIGNHMTNAATVENYPGFPEGIAGPELSSLLQRQAMDAGAEFLPAAVEGLEVVEGERRLFRVSTDSGTRDGLTVVVCTGSRLRRLDVDGEARFEGRGVSHCATCDGPLFQGRPVAVVGGGDSALDEVLVLRELASTVTMIHRGPSPTGQWLLRKRALESPNVRVRPGMEVVRLDGDDQLKRVVLRDAAGSESAEDVAGVFVLVGLEPNSTFLERVVDLDETGHVVTNSWMQTSVSGIFAAGDIRRDSASQFISAAGDGATAALAAHRFLDREEAAPGADARSGPPS